MVRLVSSYSTEYQTWKYEGIEIRTDMVRRARSKGLNAIEGNIV